MVLYDVFTKVICKADMKEEFVADSQLEALQQLAKNGNKRLDVVSRLLNKKTSIVRIACEALLAEQPQLIAPGGSAYTSRQKDAFLRDLEIFLKYVTEAVFIGDASLLDEILGDLRETYDDLGVPRSSVAVAVMKIKESAIAIASDPNGVTIGDCSDLMSEMAWYFDKIASEID